MTLFRRAERQVLTPMLTPFRDDRIDLEAFEAAIDRQIVAGADGIVVGDPIGEGSALDPGEREVLLGVGVARARAHLSVVAATGTNCTADTIERCRRAEAIGADALMVTVPYYSKPGLDGVVDHFRQVAAAVSIPVFVDDDPGRTAKDYGPDLLARLARFEIIVGIVHGGDRLRHFAGLPRAVRDRFLHLSRDDVTLPQFMQLGGQGALSPLANIVPSPVQTMTCMAGGFTEPGPLAQALAEAAAALGRDDVAALKEAASFVHQMPADVRLPLVAAEPETVVRIRHAFAPFARCEGSGRIAA